MTDAATVSVLRDIAVWVFVAIGCAVVVYGLNRRLFPLVQWNYHGNVLARPFGPPDALAAAMLVMLLTSGLFQPGALESAATSAVATPSEAEKAVNMITLMSGQLLLALGLVLYLRVVRDVDPVELFGLRQHSPRQTLKYAVIGLAVAYATVLMVGAFCSLLLDGLWPDVGAQEPVEAFQNTESLLQKGLLGIFAVLVAPLVEEIMFRGFLYGILKRFTDSYFAALATAMLFGVVHMHVASFGPLCALGVVLALAYELTGSLFVPMGIHALFNALNIMLMLAEPKS